MKGYNKHGILLLLAWFVTQIVWYSYTGGIFLREEAIVYTNIANRISQSDFAISTHFWLYAGYIAPLVLLKLLGLSFGWMYLFQLALSLGALWAFYKILQHLGLSPKILFIGSLLYATCPFVQSWNVYLYTDAWFSHGVVILLYFLVCVKSASSRSFLIIAGLLLFLSFSRPLGFLLNPIAISFYLFVGGKKNISQIAILLFGFVILTIGVVYFMKTGTDFYYTNHNLEQNIICGLKSNLNQYETIPYETGMNPYLYLLKNPELTIRLFAGRLFKSLWMTRPYFSKSHNLFIIMSMLLYYLPAIIGLLFSFTKGKYRYYPFAISILILLVPNMLLCADWHNRFMAPILPFILIFSALGLQTAREMLKKRQVGMDSQPN